MIENIDYLRSEQFKLRKKLDALERNFEAKSKVYKNHSEEKKFLRAKKDFQMKHEIILEELSIINENIKKIETKRKMDDDAHHKSQWERIRSELLGYSDRQYRTFFKQFGQACLKLKRPLLSINDIFQEIDLPDDVILKIIKQIRNSDYNGICGIRDAYDDQHFHTTFAKELSQI